MSDITNLFINLLGLVILAAIFGVITFLIINNQKDKYTLHVTKDATQTNFRAVIEATIQLADRATQATQAAAQASDAVAAQKVAQTAVDIANDAADIAAGMAAVVANQPVQATLRATGIAAGITAGIAAFKGVTPVPATVLNTVKAAQAAARTAQAAAKAAALSASKAPDAVAAQTAAKAAAQAAQDAIKAVEQVSQATKQSVGQESIPIDGIPFYIKKSRLIHQTSYLEVIATCILKSIKTTLDANNAVINSNIKYIQTKTVSLVDTIPPAATSSSGGTPSLSLETNRSMIVKIQSELNLLRESKGGNKWEVIVGYFEQLAPYEGKKPGGLPVEQNIISEEPYIDYATEFYINTLQPLSGTSNLNIELTTDGTLAKAAAIVEDKTLEQLISHLPTDGLITKGEAPPTPEERSAGSLREDEDEKFRYEYSLTVEYQYIRHICSKDAYSRVVGEAIKYTDPGIGYRREIVSDLNKKLEDKSEEEKPEEGKTEKDKSEKDNSGLSLFYRIRPKSIKRKRV